jgi:hypothetical protein
MYKLLNFLRKFLIRDTAYCLNYLFFLKQGSYREHCTFLSHEEFMKETEHKSTIRFGDGEIGLIHYSYIHYQKFDPDLRKKLIDIIKKCDEKSNYIIGIPFYINYENKRAPEFGKDKLFLWMPMKITYRLLFNKEIPYFDQHVFYRYGKAKEFFLEKTKNKKVIIVTMKENIGKIRRNDIVAGLDVSYIECSATDSFSEYVSLKEQIENMVGKNTSDFVTFLAAGPASKILAFELSQKHILCHDIGLGIEMMLTDENYEYKI